MSENKTSSIFESILSVVVKSILVTLYTISKLAENLLNGINNYLKKRIDA